MQRTIKAAGTVAVMLVAALSLACTEGPSGDLGSLAGPEFAKGKPGPNETCDGIQDQLILALCRQTEDPAVQFTSVCKGPGCKGGGAKDRNGLIGQLARADTQLQENDVSGAIEKLVEYSNKIISLRAEDKIIEPDGVDLLAGACAIITALGGTCPA